MSPPAKMTKTWREIYLSPDILYNKRKDALRGQLRLALHFWFIARLRWKATDRERRYDSLFYQVKSSSTLTESNNWNWKRIPTEWMNPTDRTWLPSATNWDRWTNRTILNLLSLRVWLSLLSRLWFSQVIPHLPPEAQTLRQWGRLRIRFDYSYSFFGVKMIYPSLFIPIFPA